MRYECDLCNYTTNDRRLWHSHKKTNRHVSNFHEKIIKGTHYEKYMCDFCKISFSRSSNLSRHLKTCVKHQFDDIKTMKLEFENKILQERINSLEKQNDILEDEKIILFKQNKLLERENDYHKELVTSAGIVLGTSMSTLNQLILNFNDAPILEPLTDYSVLEDKTKFINNIIYFYSEGQLNRYLGDFIIKKYKNPNPSKQSNWSTDTQRLTYIIREKVGKNPTWIVDKKGIRVTKIIIDPFLEYVKKIGQEYMITQKNEMEHTNDFATQKKIFDNMEKMGKIIQSINNKVLSLKINKYIVSYMYFDKKLYGEIKQS